MAKSKSKSRSMRVTVNGETYTCCKKNGKVTVRSTRTAKGQDLVAGVLNLDTGSWHNDSGDIPLSNNAKNEISKIFNK